MSKETLQQDLYEGILRAMRDAGKDPGQTINGYVLAATVSGHLSAQLDTMKGVVENFVLTDIENEGPVFQALKEKLGK